MGFLKEFKEFAIRGNVIDLAVGVIIGGAFGKITTSLVNDVIMPPVGKLLGNTDFSNMFIVLGNSSTPITSLADAKKAGVATVNYGLFLNTVLDFAIMAFVIFIMVKQINRLKPAAAPAPAPPPPPATKECPYCCEQVPAKATKCRYCASSV